MSVPLDVGAGRYRLILMIRDGDGHRLAQEDQLVFVYPRQD